MPEHFQWNYTTFLNIVFLVVFVGAATGSPGSATASGDGDGRYATDPMCGMQVEKANAPAHLVHDGDRRVVLLRRLPRALRTNRTGSAPRTAR